jgi:hypothetical protein
MRVFVKTLQASSGSAIVHQLIKAGHQCSDLRAQMPGAKSLFAAGAVA